MRDEWISLKTRTELLLGKKDINGVFFGKNGWLIDKYKGTLRRNEFRTICKSFPPSHTTPQTSWETITSA